jgi:hypothetical protein
VLPTFRAHKKVPEPFNFDINASVFPELANVIEVPLNVAAPLYVPTTYALPEASTSKSFMASSVEPPPTR